jgi:hypothetical protein
MRSYWDHLKSGQVKKEQLIANPVFRASSLFPVLNSQQIHTRIIFLGYWLVKRNISSIAWVTTLRDEHGKIILRKIAKVEEAKAFRIEVSDLLEEIGFTKEDSFFGSLETEFFSANPLIFPYPATTVNYYGNEFSSAVHTAERVFNNFEDLKQNSEMKVAECGFNIFIQDNIEPFVALVNGPIEEDDFRIEATFFNQKNEKLQHEFLLGKIVPYETRFLYLSRELNLKEFLSGQAGTVKLFFHLPWIFPRLIAGNMQDKPSQVSITHSYYDCSQATSEKDFWLTSNEKWYPASLMLPIFISLENETRISFYPIYSPSSFIIDIELYDLDGTLLGRLDKILTVAKDSGMFIQLHVHELLHRAGIQRSGALSIRLIASNGENKPIPARIKVALDITQKSKVVGCNICTNLQPFNPEWENKSKSFKWLPFLADQKTAYLFFMNSSPEKIFATEATLLLTFYREKDSQTLTRKMTLKPHSALWIKSGFDKEIDSFFEGRIGWVTVETNNPYLTTYYFAMNSSGTVGGDHGY